MRHLHLRDCRFNNHKMENSSSEEQVLISALEILSSASPGVLFCLRDRVRKTIGQITRQLASVQNPSNVTFLDSLLKSSDKIASYLGQPVSELVKRTWIEEDPRITDMRKTKSATPKENIFDFLPNDRWRLRRKPGRDKNTARPE